eukprot:UN01034
MKKNLFPKVFKPFSKVIYDIRIFRDIGFFREFSSESHSILFLSQPLDAFSIRKTPFWRYFQVRSDFSIKNEKCILGQTMPFTKVQ